MKNEISVYVHLPFCIKKCNYCDFLSGRFPDEIIKSYIERLLTQISLYGDLLSKREIISIYFGGGTPSSIPPSYISSIIRRISSICPIKTGCEMTIEMNPGTVNEDRIREYLDTGLNRFSIGLQSIHDEELKALGRIHSYGDFLKLYDMLRNRGAANISVDLMTGIPHETLFSARDSLETVCRLEPEHISVYSLILEKGTPFWDKDSRELDLPDEDTEYAIYKETEKIMSSHGYERYEISNYAKKGYECRHNIVYWELGDYIGFGAGAASRLGMRRFTGVKDVMGYIYPGPFELEEDIVLDEAECISEYMFMGLRMIRGIDISDFRKRFQKDVFDVYGSIIRKYEKEGLLRVEDRRICFTERGLDVSNVVLKEFV